ncbi:MAG: hypothetical protein SNJ77_04220 [Cytophagales bacterium]
MFPCGYTEVFVNDASQGEFYLTKYEYPLSCHGTNEGILIKVKRGINTISAMGNCTNYVKKTWRIDVNTDCFLLNIGASAPQID